VDHPCAGILGIEFDDARLRDADEHGVHWIPCGFGGAAAFRAGDHELVAVQMNRMVIHSEVDDAQPHPAAQPRQHRSYRGGGNPVERQPVELHGRSVRHCVARQNGPLLQDQAIIMVGVWAIRCFWVRDEEADLADHFLHGAVGMVKEGSFLMHGELVRVRFAGGHRFLADPRNAVLFDGDFQAVPMQ
jgi:hypothetical protein